MAVELPVLVDFKLLSTSNCCRSPILVDFQLLSKSNSCRPSIVADIELFLYFNRCRAPLAMFDASQPAISIASNFEAYDAAAHAV